MPKTLAGWFEKWESELFGEDPNAIEQQLLQMTWDFASYEILNEALRLAPSNADGSIRRSGLLFHLLERSFSQRVLVFTRRMVDRNNHSISLVRTLDQLSGQSRHIDRKFLIDAVGLVYDYKPIRQQYQAWLVDQGPGANWVPDALQWERHEERHQLVDQLTSTEPSRRSPNDAIPKRFFTNLSRRVMQAGTTAKAYVDTHIAHAATRDQRLKEGSDEIKLSFRDLRNSLRVFCEVTSLLRLVLFNKGFGSWLAIASDDQFGYLDEAIATPKDVTHLRSTWDAIEVETYSWASWGLNEYALEFPT